MRGLVAALVLALAAPLARAADAPPEAEKRFDEATRLAQSGEYAKAAAAYREVAEWPSGGEFARRAQALFCAGLQLDSAKEYEKALATFREVAARWPASPFAKRAQEEADRLDPPGARGIELRRRLNEA